MQLCLKWIEVCFVIIMINSLDLFEFSDYQICKWSESNLYENFKDIIWDNNSNKHLVWENTVESNSYKQNSIESLRYYGRSYSPHKKKFSLHVYFYLCENIWVTKLSNRVGYDAGYDNSGNLSEDILIITLKCPSSFRREESYSRNYQRGKYNHWKSGPDHFFCLFVSVYLCEDISKYVWEWKENSPCIKSKSPKTG